MSANYAYYYALINSDTGRCEGVRDSSILVLDPCYVPIETYTLNYCLKYYYPIPETVTSFDDFQGKWYTSNTYETEWTPE